MRGVPGEMHQAGQPRQRRVDTDDRQGRYHDHGGIKRVERSRLASQDSAPIQIEGDRSAAAKSRLQPLRWDFANLSRSSAATDSR